MTAMRLAAALFTFVCLSACSMAPTSSEQALVRPDDEWRQRQALQDATVILQGMSQARQRREELARTSR
jgi:hypothetical protein